MPDEPEDKDVVMTGADIICTVDGCGRPAKVRVLPVTFQRVMLCDEHYKRIGGKLSNEEKTTDEE